MKNYAYIAVSLDGYIAKEDGSLDWLSAVEEKGEDYGFQSFYSKIDTIVIGRKTYETVRSFNSWPYAGKRCIVYTSRTFSPASHESFFTGSVSELQRHLENTGASSVYVDGGRTIQGFIENNLLDELTVSVIPVLLGGGIPLFGKWEREKKLTLIESREFKSGLVQLHYALK